MAAREVERIVLMAIRPQFARAILAGTKTIEFRKRTLAADVRTVLIYETSPTQRIVGEFDLREHVVAAPANLWRRFSDVGGIDAKSFDTYFAGRDEAVGLNISAVRVYDRGVALEELTRAPAIPQSYAYLERHQVEQIRARSSFATQVERDLGSSSRRVRPPVSPPLQPRPGPYVHRVVVAS